MEKDRGTKKYRYKSFRVDEDEDPGCPTLLHLAAEKNFVTVSKSLVDECRGLLYLKTEKHGDKRPYLSVEIALMEFNDDVAAYLITQMKHEW